MIVQDNFIDTYADLKQFARVATFGYIENPSDGVVYPCICAEVPGHVREEIITKVTKIISREPENITMFMRRSPKGVDVPHIAHHDLVMGAYSLMLYLNDNDEAGTAFIRHKETGMCYAPESPAFLKIAQHDQNLPTEWAILEMIKMKENRVVIFDAGVFHCAMPIGGFGQGADSRTVLTCFFS